MDGFEELCWQKKTIEWLRERLEKDK